MQSKPERPGTDTILHCANFSIFRGIGNNIILDTMNRWIKNACDNPGKWSADGQCCSFAINTFQRQVL